jgi:hypothetical protein
LIDLPNPTRPALRSFWLISSAGGGIAASLALWRLGASDPAILGVTAAATLCVPGLVHPALAKRPYDAWNHLSGIARRAARLWLTAVAFLVITVVGRFEAGVAWSAPEAGASGWTPKRSPQPGSHRSTSDLSTAPATDGGWVRSLASWAGRSGNVWAWSLIPVLALLKVVEGKPTRSLGGNVYTLY